MAKLLPMARQSGLASEQVADELLVYDLQVDKAYCLNHTAALVWKYCDGRTSPAEIAKRMKKQMGPPVDEKVVWYALDQLGRDGLLEERLPLPASLASMTRRQHLRVLGKIAAVAVPLVTAVMAPTPALAASCPSFTCKCNGGASCPAGCHCSQNTGNGTCRAGATPGNCAV